MGETQGNHPGRHGFLTPGLAWKFSPSWLIGFIGFLAQKSHF